LFKIYLGYNNTTGFSHLHLSAQYLSLYHPVFSSALVHAVAQVENHCSKLIVLNMGSSKPLGFNGTVSRVWWNHFRCLTELFLGFDRGHMIAMT